MKILYNNKTFFIIISVINIILILGCSNSTSEERSPAACNDNIDNDGDMNIDCADEECQSFEPCINCIDLDGDGFGQNCTAGLDCDDTSNLCTIDCIDEDNDLIFDCKDDCVDKDGDNYGIGSGCIASDCDDTSNLCTNNCSDIDYDYLFDCRDDCVDVDKDGYGTGTGCIGQDCDDDIDMCNVDCEIDTNNNEHRDCDEDCIDNDSDGYGNGSDCLDSDCDDNSNSCNVDCETDANNNGYRDCDEDCIDNDSDGYGNGSDCNNDCNDNDINNWTLCNNCKDGDSDGYYAFCNQYETIVGPDVNDANPNCDSDSTDADRDGYCLNHDCDDTISLCTENCQDNDGDGIIDCNNCIETPVELYSYETGGECYDIALYGNYALVADYYNGVQIFDVSDISSPKRISTISSVDYATSVAIKDNYAFVTDIFTGILIYDITNINSPTLYGNYNNSNGGKDILIQNNFLYLVEFGVDNTKTSNFYLFDITNIIPVEMGAYTVNGNPEEIFIKDNYAYIISNYFVDWDINESGVYIIDITDPSNPQEAGSYIIPNQVPENHEQFNSVFVKDNFMFIGSNNYILRFDISVKESPERLDNINISGWIDSIFIGDHYGFIGGGNVGLYVMDITNLPEIEEIGFCDYNGWPTSFIIRDNILYISEYYGAFSMFSLLCKI